MGERLRNEPGASDPGALDVPDYYGARFFEDHVDGSLSSGRAVLGYVFEWLSPRSVVDVGCGVGAWLLAARELGAERLLGLDGDYVDRARLRIPAEDFAATDLQRQGSLAALPPHRAAPFDLVMCLEVAEHLPIERAASFVEELAQLGDVVLFSAAVPFQGGVHHINEQWPEYWALLFASQGYQCIDRLREVLWYRADIEWWYAQNVLLFVRENSAALTRIPEPVAAIRPPLALVHPRNLLFQVLHTFRVHRAAAADEEVRDFTTLAAAWRDGATGPPPLAAVERAAVMPGAADVFPNTRTDVMVPEHELAARDREILRATAEVSSLRAALQRAEAETKASGVALAEIRKTADLLERELQSVYRSASWRLTAPLRRLAGWLRPVGAR